MNRSDEEIKKDIVEQLYWDNRVDASGINVSVSNGDVMLSGSLETLSMREAARQDAEVIPGVKSITVNLDVTKSKIDVSVDKTLESTARDILSYNPDISTCDLDVRVNNGWLIVDGTVDHLWQKYHAESQLRELTGVIGITNKVAVVPRENVEDKVIAKELTRIFDNSNFVHLNMLDIKVEDGSVSLSGNVPDLFSKNFVNSVATLISGVKEVNDNVSVTSKYFSLK
jgi:osmotically-inducible protein OsmY